MRRTCDHPGCVDGYLSERVIDPHRATTRDVWRRCPQCLGTGVFDEDRVELRGLREVDLPYEEEE